MAKETKDNLLSRVAPTLPQEDQVNFHEICFMRRGKGFKHPLEHGLLVVTDRKFYFFERRQAIRVLAISHEEIIDWEGGYSGGSQKLTLKLKRKDIYFTLLPRYFSVGEVMRFSAENANPSSLQSPPAGAPVIWGSAPPPAPVDPIDDLKNKLRLLGEMRHEGLITEEDFKAKKASLLENLL